MNEDERRQSYEMAAKLISEQNFRAAVVVGAAAMILAAAAYGIVVALWPFSYGFAAAGVGIVIGSSMQLLGRGIAMKFALAAATFTTAGCILGNSCKVIVQLMQARSASAIDVLRENSILALAERSVSELSLIYLVYWFVAVTCAVFLVRRPLSRAQRFAVGMYETEG